jgi:hypothetical protein
MGLAQPGFDLDIQEVVWPQAPALHSFACGVQDGKWVFIGGRNNGLHGFLAPLAFPNFGRNTSVIVFDPLSGQRWDQPISVLPDSLREPLMTSNMQFHQTGSTLYIVGGYGWNGAQSTFITYPTLTAVDLDGLVQAVIAQQSILPFFRQVRDSGFAVCGSHLAKMDSVYHLVFGHRFDGIYDRQDTTGFHVQRYTYADRRFEIQDDGLSITVQWLPEWVDSLHFRRRDYNLVPQIFPDLSRGYTAFSGVFQKGVNLPYLYPIDFRPDTVQILLSVDQQLANYHSAVLPVYDSVSNRMSTIFFGGEAQYHYDSTATLRMDSLVPFVSTVSIMVRDAVGNLQEFVADTSMPGLLGSNAQFFPAEGAWLDEKGIIRLDKLQGRTMVGHMMGGIESPMPHISDTDPAMSWASARVFEVYLDPLTTGLSPEPIRLKIPADITVSSNPFSSQTVVNIQSSTTEVITLDLLDQLGRPLWRLYEGQVEHIKEIPMGEDLPAGLYYLKLRCGDYGKSRRLVKLGR